MAGTGVIVNQEGPWTVGATATIQVVFEHQSGDTTQYTAGDVVGDSTTVARIQRFNGMARYNGGGGIIQSAIFIDSAAAATKLDSELYLFDTAVTTQVDNAAWAPTNLDMLNCVGVIPFPFGAFKTGSSNGIIAVTGIGLGFTCRANDVNLYGILVARNAFTPASLEVFEIRLQVLQD